MDTATVSVLLIGLILGAVLGAGAVWFLLTTRSRLSASESARATADATELRATLCGLPGVGPWTAGYLAMRLLGDPDELLATDLGVRRGAAALGLPSDLAGLTARAAAWAPWRSYATTHLWRAMPAATTNGRTS